MQNQQKKLQNARKVQQLLFIYFFLFVPLFVFSLDKKILKTWEDTMKYGISSQRAQVIQSIESGKVSEAYHFIKEALVNDPNANVKISAAYALISLKISNQVTWNQALNNEKDNKVIQKVVFGITELGVRSAAPKIFELATNHIKNTKARQLSGSLIKALGKLKYAASEPFIISILTNVDQPDQLRSSSAIALGDIGAGNAVGILSNLIQNPGENLSIRMYSAFALGKTGKPAALNILYPIISNEKEDLNIRLYALGGLGYVDSKEVRTKLRELTKVDNARIRFEAVKALGVQKDKGAQEILTYKALYDPKMSVRKEAKKSLQAIGVDVDNLGKSSSSASSSSASSSSSVGGKK